MDATETHRHTTSGFGTRRSVVRIHSPRPTFSITPKLIKLFGRIVGSHRLQNGVFMVATSILVAKSECPSNPKWWPRALRRPSRRPFSAEISGGIGSAWRLSGTAGFRFALVAARDIITSLNAGDDPRRTSAHETECILRRFGISRRGIDEPRRLRTAGGGSRETRKLPGGRIQWRLLARLSAETICQPGRYLRHDGHTAG